MAKKRYAILDAIRGFALINMILYHAIWDLVYLFGFDWQWYQSQAAYIWQQLICYTFILLSGFCQPLGNNRLKRGVYIFVAGGLITVITRLAMPQNMVLFGILTLIGSCTIIASLADKLMKRCNPAVGLITSVLLFVLTRNVNRGYLGFEGLNLYKLPNIMYNNLATSYLGFPSSGFNSTDYFSLLPWVFLFFAGYFLYHLLFKIGLMRFLEKGRNKALEWIGRHSLIIYMLHQPVLYFILVKIF